VLPPVLGANHTIVLERVVGDLEHRAAAVEEPHERLVVHREAEPARVDLVLADEPRGQQQPALQLVELGLERVLLLALGDRHLVPREHRRLAQCRRVRAYPPQRARLDLEALRERDR